MWPAATMGSRGRCGGLCHRCKARNPTSGGVSHGRQRGSCSVAALSTVAASRDEVQRLAEEPCMPSVSVPLAGTPKWNTLQQQRRKFWKQPKNNELTPHFNADEFYTHDGSAPPILARPAMVRLCKVYLEPMRQKFGTCLVLSGYRHELYNQRIGGARYSQHVYEHSFESVAADLRFARGTPAQWAAYAKGLRAKQSGNGGVGRYDRSGFVHVDNRGYKADWTG